MSAATCSSKCHPCQWDQIVDFLLFILLPSPSPSPSPSSLHPPHPPSLSNPFFPTISPSLPSITIHHRTHFLNHLHDSLTFNPKILTHPKTTKLIWHIFSSLMKLLPPLVINNHIPTKLSIGRKSCWRRHANHQAGQREGANAWNMGFKFDARLIVWNPMREYIGNACAFFSPQLKHN